MRDVYEARDGRDRRDAREARDERERRDRRNARNGRNARDRHGQSGSVLLLVPAGVLIVVILGALMVDSAAAFLAEREAEATAAGIANDVATIAIDEVLLRRAGIYRIAPRRINAIKDQLAQIASEQLSAVFVPGSTVLDIDVLSPTEVRVELSGQARRIIGPFGWTALSPTYAISATAVAQVSVSG